MEKYNDLKKKFEVERFIIKEYDNWIWSLRKDQSTIGACILIPKRECLKLSHLTKEELIELNVVYNDIENILYKVFKYSKINYLTLMMIDPVVHTHIIPRYNKDITYRDSVYADDTYPNIPKLNLDIVEDFVKIEIINDLKELL